MTNEVDASPLETDFLKAAMRQLETSNLELLEIDQRMEVLKARQERLRGIVSSLETLVDSATGRQNTASYLPSGSGDEAVTQQVLAGSQGNELFQADLAEKILIHRGKEPMHYRELAEEVMRRGGRLRGRDPAAAMNAVLNRDERFVRPFRRGYYSLRSLHPKLKRNVGARRRRTQH